MLVCGALGSLAADKKSLLQSFDVTLFGVTADHPLCICVVVRSSWPTACHTDPVSSVAHHGSPHKQPPALFTLPCCLPAGSCCHSTYWVYPAVYVCRELEACVLHLCCHITHPMRCHSILWMRLQKLQLSVLDLGSRYFAVQRHFESSAWSFQELCVCT